MSPRPSPTLRRLAHVLAVLAPLLLLPGTLAVQAGLPEATERVKPSVVAVGTFQKLRSPAFIFRGTGFAVGDGTLVATNAHVLPELLQTDKGEALVVIVHVPGAKEGQPRDAKVVSVDKLHDLALLRLSGASLPTVSLGHSDAARDGQAIAFTGFPIGNALGFYPVTHRGIIASRTPIAIPAPNAQKLDARIVRGLNAGPFILFQLDATAYPGHSGSPLYDAESGEVVGIVNMGLLKGTKDAAVGQPSGISFAVPVEFLVTLIREAR